MIRKIKFFVFFLSFVCVGGAFISWWLCGLLLVMGILCLLFLFLFLVLNKMVIRTNWYNNTYLYTSQFVSNAGYRDNTIRNYDVINLGSNPAVFGFFYEGVKGQSWATGSQGLDMDFEILKYYHSYLKEGGTVIIPIMPFTAISPYIKTKSDYWDLRYYSKFFRILDEEQKINLPYYKDIIRYKRYPLLYYKNAIKYIFQDIKLDNRYLITNQPMMSMELMQDAEQWLRLWLEEFDLSDINDVINSRWDKWIDEASDLIRQMIDFCFERDLKPVLVYLPTTKYLSCKFYGQVKDRLLYDFVKQINRRDVKFLDYSTNDDLQIESLYFNSLFLNMKGRKVFTERVLSDLKEM